MKTHNGFTLIDALVAVFLIMILIMFVFSIFTSTRGGLQLSENRVSAAFIGRSLLNDLARGGFDAIKGSSGTYTLEGTDNGHPFSHAVDYNIGVISPDTDKKQVWVTMTWKEKTGDKRLVLESIFTNPK